MSESGTKNVFVGERDVVSVQGAEATSYLQGQVSQDVAGLAVGESAWSFILSPQGKVDAWFRATRTAEDGFLCDVDAGYGEVLLTRLKRFKLRTKADLALETWTLHAYFGAADDLADGFPEAPIVAPSADAGGTDVIGPDLAPPMADPADKNSYQLRRILAGIPAMGSELTESTIPAEARIVNRSVSFTKGCYTGQELVARVDSRGDNTPRRLRVVQGSGSASVGDELTIDDAPVGTITSVANNGADFAALAYIKRSAFDATNFSLAGRPVDVTQVPADQP